MRRKELYRSAQLTSLSVSAPVKINIELVVIEIIDII